MVRQTRAKVNQEAHIDRGGISTFLLEVLTGTRADRLQKEVPENEAQIRQHDAR